MTAKAFMATDGARIAYEDDGSGRPVLLVHGLGNSAAHWAFQRRALLEAGHRVIAIDLRFHGSSESTSHGARISRLGLDLRELMAAESLDDVTVVAHSMGVSVVLAAISAAGTEPFTKAVLIDESPRIVNDRDWSLGLLGVTWDRLEDQLTGRLPWGDWGREPAVPPHVRELLAAHPFTNLFAGPHAALVADHFVADWRDEVPRMDIPVWVATGAHSMSFPPAAMEWLVATLPDACLTVFNHSGHTPHWNEHEAFNRELLEFLHA